jgi:hypothetical protein
MDENPEQRVTERLRKRPESIFRSNGMPGMS